MIRLDKYLADMGIGTRSAVKQMIRKGRCRSIRRLLPDQS
nr:S4 domain-containing protein [Dorea sp. AM58-8]